MRLPSGMVAVLATPVPVHRPLGWGPRHCFACRANCRYGRRPSECPCRHSEPRLISSRDTIGPSAERRSSMPSTPSVQPTNPDDVVIPPWVTGHLRCSRPCLPTAGSTTVEGWSVCSNNYLDDLRWGPVRRSAIGSRKISRVRAAYVSPPSRSGCARPRRRLGHLPAPFAPRRIGDRLLATGSSDEQAHDDEARYC
jgi:hypothetical protein